MDYQALLLKYMQHIVAEESITYTEWRPTRSASSEVEFSDDEWDELLRIAALIPTE